MSAVVIDAIGVVISAATSIGGMFMTAPLVYVVAITIVGAGVGYIRQLLS